jgi:hypothetical protein
LAISLHRPPVRPVPSLDQIAVDPGCVAGLPADAIAALSLRCAAVQTALASAAMLTRPKTPANGGPDEWLDQKQAAEFQHRPTRWLFRNAPHLPFVRRLSRKHLVCSKRGMERWLAVQIP